MRGYGWSLILVVFPSLVFAQDVVMDRPLPPFGQPFRALAEPGQCRYLTFSPDGALLASSNHLGQTGLFDVAAGELIWTWTAPPLLASSKGDLVWPAVPLADAVRDGGRWEFPPCDGWPGGLRALFRPRTDSVAIIHNPSLSHTHFIVASGGPPRLELGSWMTGGYVHLFGGPDFEHARSIETEGIYKFSPYIPRVMHGLPSVAAADFSPDGSCVATGSSKGVCRVWSAEAGARVAEVQAEGTTDQPLALTDLDYSPDGRSIATVGETGVVRLWSAEGLTHIRDLAGAGSRGYWVEFSPDGSRLGLS